MANEMKYPAIKVRLANMDGNAFAIIGRVIRALRDGGVGSADREAFMVEAESGDYDHLLVTCMKWVTVS